MISDGSDTEECTSGLLDGRCSGLAMTKARPTGIQYPAFLIFFLEYHCYILDSGVGRTPLGLKSKCGKDTVLCFMNI